MRTWQRLHKAPELWQKYFLREAVSRTIRSFFYDRNFHEVDTPILISNPPAESYLDVFETTLLDRSRNSISAYLSTSPEVPLKKLLVAGIGDCFSFTKSFRNTETHSKLHNPEFTILEWYRVGASYTDIMKDCEELVRTLAEVCHSSQSITYQGNQIDLSVPWQRLSMIEAFDMYAHVDFGEFLELETARKIASSKGYSVLETDTWEQLYNQIFLNEVEPHLGYGIPTILYDFPASMAALSRKKSDDPRFAERFEFYIAGLELGDCYSELTDWQEQEARFQHEIEELKRLGKTTYTYDQDFIEALKVGLPACSGIAVGVDRLLMLLADTDDIADTMFFPVRDMFENVMPT